MSKFGDLVFVNLTDKKIIRKPCPDDILNKYLGGRGLATYIMLKYLGKNVEPYDSDNIIVFANGILTGTEMISSSRLHICTRSPLTRYISTSNGGGDSANELSKCHIGALIITGKSKEPVIINIQDKEISFVDATNVWGLKTGQAYEIVKQTVNDEKSKVITIGPAGENMCNSAAIMTDIGHFAGRTGSGGVMGSKNLKAIAIKGKNIVKKDRNQNAIKAVKDYIEELKKSPFYEKYSTIGSTYLVSWADSKGAGSAYNYRDIKFDGIEDCSYASKKDIVIKTKGCYKCPIKCKADIKIDSGRHKGKIMERPDFEPLVSWGPKCGNRDGRESINLHNLCNEYGIDAIDSGNLVAFAMDLYDRGIIKKEMLEGIDIKWGNIEAMEQLLDEIVYQNTWLGKVLSKGIKEAANIIGNDSEKYAFTVKGIGMTAMDPRGFKATALGYAVSARGSDYTYVYAKPEYSFTPEMALDMYGTEKAADRLSEDSKPLMVKNCIRATAIVDAIGLCKIPQNSLLADVNLKVLAQMLTGITGYEFTPEKLFKIGERIIDAERLFSYRFGATIEDDKLPRKFIETPIEKGLSKGSTVNLDKMLKEYYELMGWNEKGIVSVDKLKELDMLEFKDIQHTDSIDEWFNN